MEKLKRLEIRMTEMHWNLNFRNKNQSALSNQTLRNSYITNLRQITIRKRRKMKTNLKSLKYNKERMIKIKALMNKSKKVIHSETGTKLQEKIPHYSKLR
jgi:hypothetical protein